MVELARVLSEQALRRDEVLELSATASQLTVSGQQLVMLLILFTFVQIVATAIIGALCVRAINTFQGRLMHRFESLREDTLANYIATQREENARLVADTRAATAKMNVMADALWSGLQYADEQRQDRAE